MDLTSTYAAMVRAALRAHLAGAPVSAVERIATRAATVQATREGRDASRATVSGSILDVACDGAALYAHGRDGAKALATRANAAIRANGTATRYALDPKLAGALVSLKMRVRARSGAPTVRDTPGPIAPDAIAGRMEAARAVACRDIGLAVQTFTCGRNGAVKGAARDKIRAILHTWQGDATVLAAARAAGWRV